MLYMLEWELTREARNEAQERFLETGGPQPSGVKMLGRWGSLSTKGFVLAETDDLTALGMWIQEWGDLMTFDVIPVLTDEQMVEVFRQTVFVFEDLLSVDDRSFREILQNTGSEMLVKAMKAASEETNEKIFHNLSERASEMLREDLEAIGEVEPKVAEEAQQSIVEIAKSLEAQEKIVLPGK